MKLLIPKRIFRLRGVNDYDVCDLVNWVVFCKHRPNYDESDVSDALPDCTDTRIFMQSNIREIVRVAYELLEDYYLMGTFLTMDISGRFFIIERCVCQDELEEEFLRNFEKED